MLVMAAFKTDGILSSRNAQIEVFASLSPDNEEAPNEEDIPVKQSASDYLLRPYSIRCVQLHKRDRQFDKML